MSQQDLTLTRDVDPYHPSLWHSRNKKVASLQSQLDANVSDIYACSIIIANTCATIPFALYRPINSKTKPKAYKLSQFKKVSKERKDYLFSKTNLDVYTKAADDVEEVVRHPFLDLVYKVNIAQNYTNLKFLTTNLQDLCGECYWHVILNNSGMPVELHPNTLLAPDMTPELFIAENGKMDIRYYWKKGTKDEKIYTSKEIIFFKYDNPSNPLRGISPVAAAAGSINEQRQMNEFLSDYLLNKTRMSWFLANKGAYLNETKRNELKKSYREHTRGSEKNEVMLLQGDLAIQPFPDNIENLPFIANKKLNTQEIYRILGVPESMAFNEASNRATIDVSTDRQFMGMTIKPRLTRIEETINQSLIEPYYGSEVFVAYDECVPNDKEFELKEKIAALGGAAWQTINEVRQEEGKPPASNGDVLLIPQGLIGMPTQQMSIDEWSQKVLQRVSEKMGNVT